MEKEIKEIATQESENKKDWKAIIAVIIGILIVAAIVVIGQIKWYKPSGISYFSVASLIPF